MSRSTQREQEQETQTKRAPRSGTATSKQGLAAAAGDRWDQLVDGHSRRMSKV
jgi:hypothetical protein